MEHHIDAHLSYEPDLSPTLDPTMALENSAYVLRSRVIGRESQPSFHTGDENGATHQAWGKAPEAQETHVSDASNDTSHTSVTADPT